jgi:hypothetical protein
LPIAVGPAKIITRFDIFSGTDIAPAVGNISIGVGVGIDSEVAWERFIKKQVIAKTNDERENIREPKLRM